MAQEILRLTKCGSAKLNAHYMRTNITEKVLYISMHMSFYNLIGKMHSL